MEYQERKIERDEGKEDERKKKTNGKKGNERNFVSK
jgi:hypothetical protein